MKIRWTTGGSKRVDGWQYNPKDHALVIPVKFRPLPSDLDPILRDAIPRTPWGKEDVFILLHETGHAYYKHVNSGYPAISLMQEQQAWQYAQDCLHESQHIEMWAYAEKYCLSTYKKGVVK